MQSHLCMSSVVLTGVKWITFALCFLLSPLGFLCQKTSREWLKPLFRTNIAFIFNAAEFVHIFTTMRLNIKSMILLLHTISPDDAKMIVQV